MINVSILERNSNLIVAKNIKGARLSYFGSGGLIDYIIYPRSETQLLWALDVLNGCEHKVLGRGSNTLISDRGYRGVIVSTGRLKKFELYGSSFYCGAGVTLQELANIALDSNLSGLEKLSLIPGSVGGAVYMNAGAYGSDMSQIVEYVDVLIDNTKQRIFNKDMGFQYRRSSLMRNGGIVLGVKINLVMSNHNDISEEMTRYSELRKASQPKSRSLGSVFKAHQGIPAAKYIDPLNIKGLSIGKAEVSRQHCNFIINTGGATTDDYIALARYVQDKVYKEYKVLLATELTYIGEADEDFRRLSHPYSV